MLSKKHTAWKKNRKFGDVYGGRTFPKLADRIFNKLHNLSAPGKTDETPKFILENPSRDFYFPVTIEEIKSTLGKLPPEHTAHLTHIWLQKIKKIEYLNGDSFQGCFICGSNVYLIVLHPFPKDNKMRFGKTRPEDKNLRYYKKYSTDLRHDGFGWFLQWSEQAIKAYYLNDLLLHEIGHSVDSFYKRYWSVAAERKKENFAKNYVAIWSNNIRQTFDE
jgi:hypothetical protein